MNSWIFCFSEKRLECIYIVHIHFYKKCSIICLLFMSIE